LIDGVLAISFRERFRSSGLTYWDEAAFFLACGLGVHTWD